MSSPEEQCQDNYLEPFVLIISGICLCIAGFVTYLSIIKLKTTYSKNITSLFARGLIISNTLCIIVSFMGFGRLFRCKNITISYTASSLRVFCYIIQILVQLIMFINRFYFVFDGTVYEVPKRRRKCLKISSITLIISLCLSYIILQIYFADVFLNNSSMGVGTGILMIGVLMYTLALLFYTFISFLLLKMFISTLILLSMIIPTDHLSKDELNLAVNMPSNSETSATGSTASNESGNSKSSKGADFRSTSSADTKVSMEHNETNDLIFLVRGASRVLVLTAIGLSSTAFVSFCQLIFSNINGYAATSLNDSLLIVDSVINAICIYLTFKFAEEHFEKCPICIYCSMCCNHVIINKRAKQLKNMEKRKQNPDMDRNNTEIEIKYSDN